MDIWMMCIIVYPYKKNIRFQIHHNVRNYVLLPPLQPGLLAATPSPFWGHPGPVVKGQGLPWKFWKSSRVAEQSRDYGWGTLEVGWWDLFFTFLVFEKVSLWEYVSDLPQYIT